MVDRQRMTEAWTPASGDCGLAPSAGPLGGPAPYSQSYTYDSTGTRPGLVEHSTPNGIRRETPFGQLRSTVGTWPAAMDKGFVGGTNDNTGLTHLGAREYDPLIGRFISVDPVVDDKDPQQMHGYAYADNAPVTASDANGLWPSWADKAMNKVNNAVHTATHAVTTAVTSGAKGVYNNAGTVQVDYDPSRTGDETTQVLKTTWHHPMWDLTAALGLTRPHWYRGTSCGTLPSPTSTPTTS
jgi:RHS repeat-associated protein